MFRVSYIVQLLFFIIVARSIVSKMTFNVLRKTLNHTITN